MTVLQVQRIGCLLAVTLMTLLHLLLKQNDTLRPKQIQVALFLLFSINHRKQVTGQVRPKLWCSSTQPKNTISGLWALVHPQRLIQSLSKLS
jgi:hypothetical protein